VVLKGGTIDDAEIEQRGPDEYFTDQEMEEILNITFLYDVANRGLTKSELGGLLATYALVNTAPTHQVSKKREDERCSWQTSYWSVSQELQGTTRVYEGNSAQMA